MSTRHFDVSANSKVCQHEPAPVDVTPNDSKAIGLRALVIGLTAQLTGGAFNCLFRICKAAK